jgi:branched-chain amino acid transport system substrate-binding protein
VTTRCTRVRVAILAVVLAPTIAAFATTSVAAAAATKQPSVTIGVIAPIDGGLTSFGRGIRDSVKLAAQQANAQKTIPGWRVKVRALDDSSDPAKGTAAAEQIAKDKNVVAVVGPYNSGVAQTMLPVLAKAGIPLVSPSNTLTSLTRGDDPAHPARPWPDYFRLVGHDGQQAVFLAQQAHALGFASAAIVSETKAVSKGLADAFAAAFTADGGTVTVQQVVPDGATEFTDFLDAAIPTTPSLLFFGGEYNVAASLRTAATGAGLTAPLMGGDGMNDPEYIAGAGPDAEGSYASSVGVPLDQLDGAATFRAAYESAGFTSEPTNFGPYAYDAANAIIAALRKPLQGQKQLPKNARASVLSGLQAGGTTGITGPVSFDQYGDATSPTFTLYRVEGSPLAWTPVSSP